MIVISFSEYKRLLIATEKLRRLEYEGVSEWARYDASGVTDIGGYEWVLDDEFPETLEDG